MTKELDTLATALYVRIDDTLKAQPHLAPWRPKIGIAPILTDAELVTLAVLSALLGYTSERRWLRHARAELTGMFPYLPGGPGAMIETCGSDGKGCTFPNHLIMVSR